MSDEKYQELEKQKFEEQKLQQQKFEEQKLEQQKHETKDGKVCPSCSHVNSADSMFCEACGFDLGGGETECPNCHKLSGVVKCPFCDIDKGGYKCVRCNKIMYSHFCPECSAPLSDNARVNQRELEKELPAAPQEMSQQQAEAIIKDLNDSLTPEMQEEYKKKQERIIYRQEMEYACDRDKRIEQYLAGHSGKINLISSEEMVSIRETVERMQSFNQREKQRNDEVKKIEQEKARLEEIARQEKIDREKREEAIRQRAEIERKERARHFERIEGIWISTSPTWIETMKLTLGSGSLTGSSHWKAWDGGETRECVFTLVGEWDGSNFKFHSTQIKDIHGRSGQFRFCGTVNDAGTILSGYFIDNRKINTQQVFFKQ